MFAILFILMMFLLVVGAVRLRAFLDSPLSALDGLLSDIDVAAGA